MEIMIWLKVLVKAKVGLGMVSELCIDDDKDLVYKKLPLIIR
jgi:hypothetical protein